MIISQYYYFHIFFSSEVIVYGLVTISLSIIISTYLLCTGGTIRTEYLMHGMCAIIQLSVRRNNGNRMRFLRRTRTAFDLVPIEEQDFRTDNHNCLPSRVPNYLRRSMYLPRSRDLSSSEL